jgi:hypothetical protein
MPRKASKSPIFSLTSPEKDAVQLSLQRKRDFGMIEHTNESIPFQEVPMKLVVDKMMKLVDKLTLLYVRATSGRAELDEKALLIALFVLAAVVGLSPLGQAIANKFSQMASALR